MGYLEILLGLLFVFNRKFTKINKSMKRQKGFTLIELLVVIAIIGILAVTVVAKLGEARNRAKDAKVKGALAGARAQAEIVADQGDYDAVCDDATIQAMRDSGSSTGVCNDSSTAWAIAAPLYSDTSAYWCVDSTGVAKKVTTALGTNTQCPNS